MFYKLNTAIQRQCQTWSKKLLEDVISLDTGAEFVVAKLQNSIGNLVTGKLGDPTFQNLKRASKLDLKKNA